MITLHNPIMSTADTDLSKFLHQIERSNITDKEECFVVKFVDGKPTHIRKFGEFILEGDAEEPLCYDNMTGIKCYTGDGFALFSKGEETSLSAFNKYAIRDWVKKNWKEGILVDWTKVSYYELKADAMQATRESYDWK